MADLNEMSVEELEREVIRLDGLMSDIREQKRLAARAMEARIEADRAKAKLAAMSESERQALAQALADSNDQSR